jgi:DNA-binding NarL/FixJ family response regulator
MHLAFIFAPMGKKKIILVDAYSFLRKALKNTLQSIGDVDIIAEASDGQEFLSLLETLIPDIVFIEIQIPGINGIEATKIAIKKHPEMVIIGFSSSDKQCYIDQMIQAGAKGYLSKCTNNYEALAEIIKYPAKRYFYSNDSTAKEKRFAKA